MNEPAHLPAATANVPAVPADTVFSVLSEPARRRILGALFDGQWHAARSLGGSLPKQFDLIRKHLDVLVKARLVEAQFDPQDKRRQVYRLAGTVKTETTPQGRTMDFGCCIVRC